MTTQEQVAVILVGRDQLSKVLEKVGAVAEKQGARIEKTFGQKLKDVGKTAGSIGKTLSIGISAPLGLFAGVAVNAAVKTERLTKTLEGMAGGAKEAAAYVSAIKDASGGTVSAVEALEIANRALSFQVVKNTGEMAELTKVAITLGRAQGLDAARATTDLTTALSRNSPMILDNLGITLKLTEAYAIYAESIGVSVSALSDEQKAIAFREAALIKGMEAVERMGGLQDDMAASGERAKAQMADLAAEVGKELVPFMQMGIDFSSKLIAGFQALSPETKKLAIGFGAVAMAAGPALLAFSKLTGAIGSVVEIAPKAISGLKGIVGAMGGGVKAGALGLAVVGLVIAVDHLRDVLKKVDAAYLRAQKAAAGWSEEVDKQVKEGVNLDSILEGLAGRTNKATDAMNRNIITGTALGGLFGSHVKILKLYGTLQDEVNTAVVANTTSYADYKKAVELYNLSVKDSNAHVEIMTTLQYGLQTVLIENQGILGQYDSDMAEFNRLAKEGTGDVTDFSGAMYQQGEELENIAWRTGDAAQAVRDYVYELGEGERKLLDMELGLANTTSEIKALHDAQRTTTDVISFAAGAMDAAGIAAGNLAERARNAAAAQEEMRAATAAASTAQANLITSMKDATDEMFKQEVLAAVDPADVGVNAWAALGKELGLLTTEQVALAEGAAAVIDAYKEGIVPTENMAEATSAVYDAALLLNPEFDAILDEYARAPGLIGPTKDALVSQDEVLKLLGDKLPVVDKSMINFDKTVGELVQPASDATEKMGLLEQSLQKVAKTWHVTVEYHTVGKPAPGMPGSGDYLPGGPPSEGEMPDPPDDNRRALGGMITGGALGAPVWVQGHVGEYVSNPYRRGAMGGPGGPPAPGATGGNTYNTNVTINDRLAMALFLEDQRQERYERLSNRI